MNWISQGTKAITNIDTYVYSSIQGTLESIHDLLLKGRINDSYALLRKYYDSSIINVYSNLYLSDHVSIDNFIVSQIDNWRKGTETLPEFRIMSKYILFICKNCNKAAISELWPSTKDISKKKLLCRNCFKNTIYKATKIIKVYDLPIDARNHMVQINEPTITKKEEK